MLLYYIVIILRDYKNGFQFEVTLLAHLQGLHKITLLT